MATRREKAKWLVKLLKVIVVVYLLLILYQLIGNVYSRLSNTHTFVVVIVIHVWKCIFQKKQILWYIILFNQFYDISDCLKQLFVIIYFHSMH